MDEKTARGSCDRKRGRAALHVDKDHGRLETCRYWITEELRTLPNTEPCRGLRSIGLVGRSCLIGETEPVERRFWVLLLRLVYPYKG